MNILECLCSCHRSTLVTRSLSYFNTVSCRHIGTKVSFSGIVYIQHSINENRNINANHKNSFKELGKKGKRNLVTSVLYNNCIDIPKCLLRCTKFHLISLKLLTDRSQLYRTSTFYDFAGSYLRFGACYEDKCTTIRFSGN